MNFPFLVYILSNVSPFFSLFRPTPACPAPDRILTDFRITGTPGFTKLRIIYQNSQNVMRNLNIL